MATFIIYAIRWAVTLTLLYSLYRLLLRRETFHRLNRAVLLGILVVSPLLPLVPLHTDKPTAMDAVLTRIEDSTMWLPSVGRSNGLSVSRNESSPQGDHEGLSMWLIACVYIYIIGVAVALALYMSRLLALMRVIRRSQRIAHPIVPKDVHLMLDMRTKQPSSWLHWILIGPIDLKQNAETILRHELAHVRMRHSWDLLLCDLSCRLLWCVPFVWMLRQDLVDVHEFQADEAVLQGGATLEDYEHLLVRKAVQPQLLPVMNTLRRGAVKKRLSMMHCPRSSRWARFKLLYLIPALAVSLWVSAKAEEYKVYVNDRLVSKEELASIDPATIDHVDVIHSQKSVVITTVPEPVDTRGVMPGVLPEEAYFDMVEQMPEFPGGKAALDQYLARHIRYPQTAAENGVQGVVSVEFIVEADGSITHVHAQEATEEDAHSDIKAVSYRSATDEHPNYDEGKRALRESAEELFRGMPPFEPGRQQGRAVRVKMVRRIAYGLN